MKYDPNNIRLKWQDAFVLPVERATMFKGKHLVDIYEIQSSRVI